MPEEIEILKTNDTSFVTMQFRCVYCSSAVIRTFNTTNMCDTVLCGNCSMSLQNTGKLATDIDKRIEEHVIR